MFVTTGTRDATSSDIGTYDGFVNADAGGATYDGSVISWQAIGSTATVNAIDHIGVTGSAVYLVDGTMVASSDGTSGLWSGSLLNAPNEFLDGTSASAPVWTGTSSNGSKFPYSLGNQILYLSVHGLSDSTDSTWAIYAGQNTSVSAHFYGISSDLVVPGAAAVPEPSTAVLAGLGGLAGLVYSFARKRK